MTATHRNKLLGLLCTLPLLFGAADVQAPSENNSPGIDWQLTRGPLSSSKAIQGGSATVTAPLVWLDLDMTAQITNISPDTATYPEWDYSARNQEAGSTVDWFGGGTVDTECITIPEAGLYDFEIGLDWSVVINDDYIRIFLVEDNGCNQTVVNNIGEIGLNGRFLDSTIAGAGQQRQRANFRNVHFLGGEEITVQAFQSGTTSNVTLDDTDFTYFRVILKR